MEAAVDKLFSATDHEEKQTCMKEACAIQACLEKNQYQEKRCQDVIDKLRACCEKLLDEGGSSPSCPTKKFGRK
ncbi:mature-T-cell-proliferation protein [Umbelopsis sp. PMI_123]|nr:mature-T-cell-proliferation protein [Umbelopsis sp. PMI_123]